MWKTENDPDYNFWGEVLVFTLWVSSAASFSQFATSLSCSITFFGSFWSGFGLMNYSKTLYRERKCAQVHFLSIFTKQVWLCPFGHIYISFYFKFPPNQVNHEISGISLLSWYWWWLVMLKITIAISLNKTCKKKQAAECAIGFPMALVTRKTKKPIFQKHIYFRLCL